MKTATFEFKCRRCGKITADTCTSKDIAGMTLTEVILRGSSEKMHNKRRWIGSPISLIDNCFCKDGGEGIADLIGFKLED